MSFLLIVSAIIAVLGLIIWQGAIVKLLIGQDPKSDYKILANWIGKRITIFGIFLCCSQLVQMLILHNYYSSIDTLIALVFVAVISFNLPKSKG